MWGLTMKFKISGVSVHPLIVFFIATGVYVTLCSLNRGWTTFGSRLASEIREASYSEQPHLYFAAANPINAKGRLQMILLYQSNKATFR